MSENRASSQAAAADSSGENHTKDCNGLAPLTANGSGVNPMIMLKRGRDSVSRQKRGGSKHRRSSGSSSKRNGSRGRGARNLSISKRRQPKDGRRRDDDNRLSPSNFDHETSDTSSNDDGWSVDNDRETIDGCGKKRRRKKKGGCGVKSRRKKSICGVEHSHRKNSGCKKSKPKSCLSITAAKAFTSDNGSNVDVMSAATASKPRSSRGTRLYGTRHVYHRSREEVTDTD